MVFLLKNYWPVSSGFIYEFSIPTQVFFYFVGENIGDMSFRNNMQIKQSSNKYNNYIFWNNTVLKENLLKNQNNKRIKALCKFP